MAQFPSPPSLQDLIELQEEVVKDFRTQGIQASTLLVTLDVEYEDLSRRMVEAKENHEAWVAKLATAEALLVFLRSKLDDM